MGVTGLAATDSSQSVPGFALSSTASTHRCALARAWVVLAVGVLTIGMLGSSCVMPPASTGATDGNANVDPKDFPNLRVQGEPNDTFSQALDVVIDDAGHASLQGSISTPADIDVYALGPMSVGDRIVVDVGTAGNLDSAVVLFDEGGRLAFENDDRDTNLQQLDPFINQVVRRESLVYFLAISAAPLGSSSTATGNYDIQVTITREGAPVTTSPQTVVLNFSGGTVNLPDDPRAPYTVGAFNTSDIWPDYAGLTTAVQNKIVEVVKDRYRGVNMTVLRTPGDVLPGGTCSYSTLYFGGRNPNAYGTSQQVDQLNADPCDIAIVFTEMFTPGRFGRLLTADELGTAIGNVAAHEMGHLLGLNHVNNVTDLMDTTGGANTFLFNQQFKDSPLNDTIFGIGSQDGLLLLLETLGAASQ